ncbi:hypothetical protein [Idiomarina abyssalis]|uniref:hypothetical protein n=1 Tax=Idiomarina abyssalis TaxID=86102 RepID=UPI003A8CD2F9
MTRVDEVRKRFSKRLIWLFLGSVVLVIIGRVKEPSVNSEGLLNSIQQVLSYLAPYADYFGSLLFGAVIVASLVDYTLTQDRLAQEEKETARKEREQQKLVEEREALKQQLADDRADQKRQLQKELTALHQQNAKNVLSSVYQRLIPEAAFKEIESVLFNARLERKRYNIGIILRKLENIEGMSNAELSEYLALTMHSSYRLYNLTDKEYDTKVEFGLEIPNEQKLQQVTKIDSIMINGEEKLSEGKSTKNNHICDASVPVKIPAKGYIDVSMSGQSVKRKIDSEVWASLMPSDGVIVSIEGPDGLEIECRPNHSKQFEIRPTPKNINKKQFELNHGILPHQSIVAWWNGENIEANTAE